MLFLFVIELEKFPVKCCWSTKQCAFRWNRDNFQVTFTFNPLAVLLIVLKVEKISELLFIHLFLRICLFFIGKQRINCAKWLMGVDSEKENAVRNLVFSWGTSQKRFFAIRECAHFPHVTDSIANKTDSKVFMSRMLD